MAMTIKLANQDLTIYDVLTFSIKSSGRFDAFRDMAHDPDLMTNLEQDFEGMTLNKFIEG